MKEADNPRTLPNSSHSTKLEVKIYGDERIQQSFTEILQKGFVIDVNSGASVGEVVRNYLGIEREYLDHRVNTIFLNGRAVDDVEYARVGHDAILSLSASMPGFVGAALRKGGFYSAMRAEITHSRDNVSFLGQNARITVRLYNIIAREIGPRLLRSGIRFSLTHLLDFFMARSESFWNACKAVAVNEQEVHPERLKLILERETVRDTLVTVQVLISER